MEISGNAAHELPLKTCKYLWTKLYNVTTVCECLLWRLSSLFSPSPPPMEFAGCISAPQCVWWPPEAVPLTAGTRGLYLSLSPAVRGWDQAILSYHLLYDRTCSLLPLHQIDGPWQSGPHCCKAAGLCCCPRRD